MTPRISEMRGLGLGGGPSPASQFRNVPIPFALPIVKHETNVIEILNICRSQGSMRLEEQETP